MCALKTAGKSTVPSLNFMGATKSAANLTQAPEAFFAKAFYLNSLHN